MSDDDLELVSRQIANAVLEYFDQDIRGLSKSSLIRRDVEAYRRVAAFIEDMLWREYGTH